MNAGRTTVTEASSHTLCTSATTRLGAIRSCVLRSRQPISKSMTRISWPLLAIRSRRWWDWWGPRSIQSDSWRTRMRNESRPRIARTGNEGEGRVALELRGFLDVVPVLLEPKVDLLQTVFEAGLRLVVENPPGFLNGGEEPVLLVPIPSLFEHNSCRVFGEGVDLVRQVKNSDFSTRGKVDCFTNSFFRRGAAQEPVHNVTDIRKVPRLLTGPSY